MRRRFALLALLLGFGALPAAAQTTTVCTVAADVGAETFLKREGDCETRVTPASTFKIAIALMGYDAGILTDEHTPVMPFRDGYPAWIASWKADTDPTSWIRNSVVWYSQKITEALGAKRFAGYVDAFHYGNRDVSGEPGKNDGLTRSWLGSSLKISPLEQVAFLRAILDRRVPVAPKAVETTIRLLDTGSEPGGWHVHGKTGAATPRRADGTPDTGHPVGWFVGWAEKDGRTVVFARLVHGDGPSSLSPGLAAKESILADLFATPGSL